MIPENLEHYNLKTIEDKYGTRNNVEPAEIWNQEKYGTKGDIEIREISNQERYGTRRGMEPGEI